MTLPDISVLRDQFMQLKHARKKDLERIKALEERIGILERKVEKYEQLRNM